MKTEDKLLSLLPFPLELKEELVKHSEIKDVPQNTELMREGQYVKRIPIVLEGLVKVFTKHEDKELLLYYIRPQETCIVSFNSVLTNTSSKAFAQSEKDSKILLMPLEKVFQWMKEFPELNHLFFRQYNIRYSEMIQMVTKVLFDKMDKRLYEYLSTKVKIWEKDILKISHQQIANDLGTAREVVSRVLKKLEYESKLVQNQDGIKILKS